MFHFFSNRYYTTLFFSLVCSTSDHFAEHESFDLYSETILSFILDFLQLYTVEEVLRIEVSAEYFWSTLKPFVNLVYFSYERKINSKLVKEKPLLHELYSYSLRATIFCLTVACTRGSDCIDVLEKENQIDFLICLPWYVNAQFRNEAQALVDVLSSKKRLDPPKLLNIAKARLATISGFTPEEILNKTFDIHRQFYQNWIVHSCIVYLFYSIIKHNYLNFCTCYFSNFIKGKVHYYHHHYSMISLLLYPAVHWCVVHVLTMCSIVLIT